MTFLCLEDYKGLKTNFLTINNVKFKRKIIPGDQLIIESNLKNLKRGIASGNSIGRVNNELACSADFVVAIPEILNKFKPITQN